MQATFHQLGWIPHPTKATLAYTREGAAVVGVWEGGAPPLVHLPRVEEGEHLVVHTSPQVGGGELPQVAEEEGWRLFLLGELTKIGVVSPARVEGVSRVGEGLVARVAGEVGEQVDLAWLWTDGTGQEKIQISGRCFVGKVGGCTGEVEPGLLQGGRVDMLVTWRREEGRPDTAFACGVGSPWLWPSDRS